MKNSFAILVVAAAGLLSLHSSQAQERIRDGVIGAGAGAIVGGPVGAIVGGTAGYVAGPRVTHAVSGRLPHRHYLHRRYHAVR